MAATKRSPTKKSPLYGPLPNRTRRKGGKIPNAYRQVSDNPKPKVARKRFNKSQR